MLFRSPIVSTTSTHFRSGYARCALYLNTSSGNFVKGNQFSGGAITSGWLTWRNFMTFSFASDSPIYLGFGQFSSQKYLGIGSLSSDGNGKVHLFKYDGTTKTSLASESGTSLLTNVLQKLDMQVINYGATATVNVYVDGVLVLTFTGDVTVTGMTDMDCVVFSFCQNANFFVSEVIVADEDTRAFSLVTMAGTGAGDTDAWTGAYTDCNPITINDANAVYTATAGLDEQFNITDLPSGTFSVKACLVAARAEKTSGSPIGTLKLGWKTGGTVNVDAGHSLTTAWACYERLALLNPVTATNWAQSDMNALQEEMQSAT